MGWARDQGHLVFGIEIEAPQLVAAKRAGFNVADSIEALQTECDIEGLDGVVAFDVFEHLTHAQLVKLLIDLRFLLKPRGWILEPISKLFEQYGN